GERPVRHPLGDELGIGDDDLGSGPGAHGAGAHADPRDLTLQIADLDDVAHVDRPLEQEDEPGHEIVDDALQAEADADAERAGQDGDLGEVKPEYAEGEQEAEGQDPVIEQARDGGGDAARHVRARINVLTKHKTNESRDEVRQPDREDELEHVAHREADRAAAQLRRENRTTQRPGRLEETDTVEEANGPRPDREHDQDAVDAALQQVAMVPDHLKQVQRPYTQRERDHAGRAGGAGARGGRGDPAAEYAGGEEPRQAHVAGGPRRQSGREREDDEAGSDPEHAHSFGLRTRTGPKPKRSTGQRA